MRRKVLERIQVTRKRLDQEIGQDQEVGQGQEADQGQEVEVLNREDCGKDLQ